MAHPLSYIELAWYVGVALGAFKLLSEFAITMIAIFGKDKLSDRAFRVLELTRRRRLPGQAGDRPRAPRGEVTERGEPPTGPGMPLAAESRWGTRPPEWRSPGQDVTRPGA